MTTFVFQIMVNLTPPPFSARGWGWGLSKELLAWSDGSRGPQDLFIGPYTLKINVMYIVLCLNSISQRCSNHKVPVTWGIEGHV